MLVVPDSALCHMHNRRKTRRIALYVNLRSRPPTATTRMSGTPAAVSNSGDSPAAVAAEHVGNVLSITVQRLFQRRNYSRAVPQRRIQHGRLDRAVMGCMTALCS